LEYDWEFYRIKPQNSWKGALKEDDWSSSGVFDLKYGTISFFQNKQPKKSKTCCGIDRLALNKDEDTDGWGAADLVLEHGMLNFTYCDFMWNRWV
jgi:hypothetical protein